MQHFLPWYHSTAVMQYFLPWYHSTAVMQHFLPWYHFTAVMQHFLPWYHFTAVMQHFLPWYHFTAVIENFLLWYNFTAVIRHFEQGFESCTSRNLFQAFFSQLQSCVYNCDDLPSYSKNIVKLLAISQTIHTVCCGDDYFPKEKFKLFNSLFHSEYPVFPKSLYSFPNLFAVRFLWNVCNEDKCCVVTDHTADIRVPWLVYVRTYCVPIATLNQNKRTRLFLYFGRRSNKKRAARANLSFFAN